MGMRIWTEWWSWVAPLRPACSRLRSFLWLLTALAGISIRSDFLGVTSIVRALGLGAQCYDRLLDFFHSQAVDPDALCRCWVRIVFARMPGIHRVNGRPVLLGDGLKIPKRGRKMPAVKLLHQVSDCNTKPEYIMGHSFQVVSILVSAAATFFAVPLSARIHEGLVFSNRDQRTLPKKFLSLVGALAIAEPVYLVADAYYACCTMALGLTQAGSHLISRLRKTCVAFEPIPPTMGQRKRGHPRLRRKGRADPLSLSGSAVEADPPPSPLRAGRTSGQGTHRVPVHGSGSEPDRDYPALRPALQDRDLLQAGRPHAWRLRLSLLDEDHGQDRLPLRRSVSPPQDRPVPRRHPAQTDRLPSLHPDRSDRARGPSMRRHDCAHPGLVQLRLLALYNQTRNSPFRVGRDDRSQKFTP